MAEDQWRIKTVEATALPAAGTLELGAPAATPLASCSPRCSPTHHLFKHLRQRNPVLKKIKTIKLRVLPAVTGRAIMWAFPLNK